VRDFIAIDGIVGAGERSLSARKGFSGREEYFEAHLPRNPVVPGVYLLESLSECVRWLVEMRSGFRRTTALRAVRQAKFTRPVRPGEVLALTVHRESGADQPETYRGEGRMETYRGEGRIGLSGVVSAELDVETVAVTDHAYAAHRRDTLRFLLPQTEPGGLGSAVDSKAREVVAWDTSIDA
jgi:hypothetical protein